MTETSNHEFTWTSGHLSIRIEVAYSPKLHIYDHLGIRSVQPERAPLPITETGYRSHYLALGAVEEFGGPVAVTKKLLDEAATSPEWLAHLASARQGSLF